MKQMLCLAVATLAFAAVAQADDPSTASAATPTAAPASSMSAAECDVWNREISFAASVENHDAAAFAEHLHPGAVFLGGNNKARRGSADIAAAWAGIVEGKEGVLHWHPDTVVIGGDPNVALSRGPWWIADTSPDAKQPFLRGNYISTWVKGDDGVWHVLFDGGNSDQPAPASAEDIAKLVASFPTVCPAK